MGGHQQQLGRETGVTQETTLRPHRHLFLRGIVAVLALTTPVFAVLYWLTIPNGPWPSVLAGQLLVFAATILGVQSFLATAVVLTEGGVRVRDGLGRTRELRGSDVATTHIVQLYDGSTLDTLPQLFATDAEGRTLLRMRGQFWAPGDLERVAEQLEAPVSRPDESMTFAQLRRSCPRMLAWYERLPRLG